MNQKLQAASIIHKVVLSDVFAKKLINLHAHIACM